MRRINTGVYRSLGLIRCLGIRVKGLGVWGFGASGWGLGDQP